MLCICKEKEPKHEMFYGRVKGHIRHDDRGLDILLKIMVIVVIVAAIGLITIFKIITNIGLIFQVSINLLVIINPYTNTTETFHDEMAWKALFSNFKFDDFTSITKEVYEQAFNNINRLPAS